MSKRKTRVCKVCRERKPLNQKNFYGKVNKNAKKGVSKKIWYSRKCRGCERNAQRHKDTVRTVRMPELRYLCVGEPKFTGYYGRYLLRSAMEMSLKEGHMPENTIWYLGAQDTYYIVCGSEFEEQHLKKIKYKARRG